MLDAAIAFLTEIDQLKRVERRSCPVGLTRRENTAEHSWHVAMTALTLAPYAAEPVRLDQVIRLLLVHDIVEIDAGDTFVYDTAAHADKHARERAAAERIFGLLPGEAGADMRALWDEYEAGETPEARFAHACDRTIPILLNLANAGQSWREHGVRFEQVVARNQPLIADVAPAIWAWLLPRLEAAHTRGWLA